MVHRAGMVHVALANVWLPLAGAFAATTYNLPHQAPLVPALLPVLQLLDILERIGGRK